MTVRRRLRAPEPDIPASVIAMLLDGWSGRPPEGEPFDSGAAFDHFAGDREGTNSALLWSLHEAYLRHKAAEWDITPRWTVYPPGGPYRGVTTGGRLFFAEACAAQQLQEQDDGDPAA